MDVPCSTPFSEDVARGYLRDIIQGIEYRECRIYIVVIQGIEYRECRIYIVVIQGIEYRECCIYSHRGHRVP